VPKYILHTWKQSYLISFYLGVWLKLDENATMPDDDGCVTYKSEILVDDDDDEWSSSR